MSSKLTLCCAILTAFHLAGSAAQGSISAAGNPPKQDPSGAPKVTSSVENPNEDQEWTPLLFKEEHQPMPALKEVFEGIKRGGPENFEAAIRAAYHLMEAYGRNEGNTITLQLSDFKTRYVPEALDLKYSEIVSLDIPEHIEITGNYRQRNVQDRPNGPIVHKTTSVGYQMKWEPVAPDPDQALWLKRSVKQYVEIAKADFAALSRLRAVTTYRVSVAFEGTQRDYRASFLWMDSETAPVIGSFVCIDHVLERVTLVLTEQVPPEGKEEGEPIGLKPQAEGLSSKYAYPVCNVYTEYPPSFLKQASGYERHINSNWHHISASEVDASCSCSSACQSICNTSVSLNLCYDEGNTTSGYHVGAKNMQPTSNVLQNALNVPNGASCQGTTLCAFTQCATANCIFGVTINPSGIGFSTNPSNTLAFWANQPTSQFTCRGCTEWEQPVVEPDIPAENCPVLVALDEGRLEMTNLAGGIRFDVNRDGVAERNSWPAIGSSWAFVVLDRNLNGRIDNGGELFGNYTAQRLDDKPRNGYAALAAYDDPANGGNGDGILDSRDPIFSSLLLWTDANHDGISQPDELAPLAQRVEAIGLDYRESRSRDRYGNQFRYRGTVWLADGRRSRSVDVFLLHD